MVLERTLLMIKPDGVEAKITGEVISRVERKGLKIVAIKKFLFTRELAEKFYAVHKNKPFFNELIEYITSGEVVALLVEGESAIKVVRNLVGPTDSTIAPPGTIRGDFGTSIQRNVVHASDSPESSQYEIKLIFG
ncbi:nucleoside-diphosphate kinase [Candidatus Marsarchaeota G2 archaeon ECH_B_SAG-F08]|uniref:Nucleoside diphosphate kinase n=3 Tax=Candidatus Marsarchaeota TaxID=1978152 RepID=A0A2R6AK46_9ARCH|nr:MAG: nucleoside-diphosphate kinase [Candidatus Marsarchaeota G1 archaeon BE_D]PSN89727.1 MAG: nucleoside-diphosphate kinase [Candidatus Marsarchaeota G1 archaeon OSP_C]PSN97886.1 MAG: nucleoside-diphosphate kinase [Candidatus Marsarchaeota G2 archaeon ECH_B_SAG-F08]